MSDPITPEMIGKLPKWAQLHIRNLTWQREAAVKALNEFQDQQTPGPISFDKYPGTGETRGPSVKVGYIQSDRIKINHAGVSLVIYLTRERDPQRDYGIELDWQAGNRVLGQTAMIPKSYQQVMLIAKENMR